MKSVDISNCKYGKLTAIKKEYVKQGNSYWLCKCDCGNECIVALNNLRRNHTNSCGCLSLKKRTKQNNLSSTRIYRIYHGIKQRCYNPNSINYKNYGARGITMCNDWLNDFQSFYKWGMDNGYEDKLTIDRIDSNGNYEPLNCRWVTMKKQQNNRRNNHYVTYKEETKTISEWSRILQINKETLRFNLNKNPNYLAEKIDKGGG